MLWKLYVQYISAQIHINPSSTCFTLHSCPPHVTGTSVRSCAGPSILTGTGTDGCTGIRINKMQLWCSCALHYRLRCVCYLTYVHTEAHSHSRVHWTGRFYCLIPALCSLHHRCRSLQSCRLYWRDCVAHLWEYQDHHSQRLEKWW